MNSLEQMFPSLTLFSDLNWDTVKAEYESDYSDLSFPEYLQQKCIEGDCPPYLFELAFYEQALFELKTMTQVIPNQNGIYLNPYSLFLSLFKDKNDQISIMEATDEDLFLLQKLEEGPREDDSFVEIHQKKIYEKFLQTGLIWSVSSGQLF